MVDTVRTDAAILALLADNDAGDISPQDLRDAIVTLMARTGWGDYVDAEYSSGAPFQISADTDTQLENNAAGASRTQEVPADIAANGGFYNGSTDRLLGLAGDAYLLTVEHQLRRTSGSGAYTFETWLDIGGSAPDLYRRTFSLPGGGVQNVTYTTGIYSLDTFETNGGAIMVRSSVPLDIFAIRFIVFRLHAGQGTYPEE